MKKTHQSPEFTVIKQNQANAKFFVASGGFTGTNPTPSQGTGPAPTNSASQYDAGGNIDM